MDSDPFWAPSTEEELEDSDVSDVINAQVSPTPYTPQPTPQPPHPTPFTLHPTPYTIRPISPGFLGGIMSSAEEELEDLDLSEVINAQVGPFIKSQLAPHAIDFRAF